MITTSHLAHLNMNAVMGMSLDSSNVKPVGMSSTDLVRMDRLQS